MAPPRHGLSVDGEGVRRYKRRLFRKDLDERLAWRDLECVEVVSSMSLAGADDLFVVLHGANETGVVVGYSVAQSTGILDRLHALPGYDHEAVVRMVGTPEGRAEAWRREQ